ncbi:MAG: diguanylate cyclase [Synechococcus sp.]|nr:diguanylate cyclase [Synechococcus sp.]
MIFFGRSLAIGFAYAGVGLLMSQAATGLNLSFPFWPSAGLAVALILAYGYRYLPAIALGSIVLNSFLSGGHIYLACALAAGSTLQTALAVWCGHRISGQIPALRRSREILLFLLSAGPLCSVIGGSVGALAQYLAGTISENQLFLAAFTWWAGDALGIIVFTPATLMFIPVGSHQWTGRRTKILFPSLLLIAMAAIAYVQISAFDQQRVQGIIQDQAQRMAFHFERILIRHTEVLQGVRSFVLASENVTAKEFRTFTQYSLQKLPSIYTLSWDPLIFDNQRQAFEQRQRLDPLIPDNFQITEMTLDGRLIRAQKRTSYVAVQFVEPLEDNLVLLGFDIQSHPQRAEAILKSIRADAAYASEPISLISKSGKQQGTLVILPVQFPGESLRGFVTSAYQFTDLLEETFANYSCAHQAGCSKKDLQIKLLFLDSLGKPLRLAQLDPSPDTTLLNEPEWTFNMSIDYWGRTWQLQIQPTEEALRQYQTYTPQLVLLFSLMLLLLNEAFLLLVTAEEMAERRQAAINSYQASHDPLTNLLNRRAFFATLEQARSEVDAGLASHVLLFCDLDHFKPVNDTCGHQAGDELLRDVTQLITQQVRSEDKVARIGGDEFAILLRNCPLKNGITIAEAIVSALNHYTFYWQRKAFKITVSIGLILIEKGQGSLLGADELINQVDQACYKAKNSGRNQVYIA